MSKARSVIILLLALILSAHPLPAQDEAFSWGATWCSLPRASPAAAEPAAAGSAAAEPAA
jgi:hypothetical protein